MSPLEYFKLFFTEDIFSLISEQSNFYFLQKYGKILNSSQEEYKKFIGIWLQMGIVQMPPMRLSSSRECRYPPVADIISRNRFFQLLQSFHLADNQKMLKPSDENFDKLYKVRPLLLAISNALNQIPPEEYNCVDEQIIPFKGRHVLKQYVRNKPHKWGYKVFTRAGQSGIMYAFAIYVGKNTCKDYGLGISGDIVISLVENVPTHQQFKVATDNWFSSLSLALALKERGILFVGTVRQDRIGGCCLKSEVELKKNGRGSYDWRVEKEHNLSLVRWIDRKSINFLSSYASIEPLSTCKRYSAAERKFIDIQRPNIVEEYNKYMGGVDLIDMLVELYRTDIKSRKWYIRIVLWCISISVTNSWLLYRRHCNQRKCKPSYTLLQFQSHIAFALTESGKITQKKRGRPSTEKMSPQPASKLPRQVAKKIPVSDIRYDGIDHIPDMLEKRGRCKVCIQSATQMYCSKCNVYLRLTVKKKCFQTFHKK